MYYTYPPEDLSIKKINYASYVDSLRAHFIIRIEVFDSEVCGDKIRLQILKDKLERYLTDNVGKEKYHIQYNKGYVGLLYTWFMDKEDAVAFALTFNGKAT